MTAAEGFPATAAKERLTQFLKDGKEWERKATNIPGIFLFKLSIGSLNITHDQFNPHA